MWDIRPRALAPLLVCACGCASSEARLNTDSGAPVGRDAGGPDDAPRAPPCPEPDAGVSTGSPSFSAEVFPLLNASCGSFACHNDAFRNQGLFLGPSPDEYAPTAATQVEVHASLLARSMTAPGLWRVKPGSPEESFLMFKVDGCQAALAGACPSSPAGKPCGDPMPLAAPRWSAAKRALLRAWIADGAPGP